MTRGERRLAIRTGVLGVLLTLLVMAADYAGFFQPLEGWLYDQRARHCQFFARTPTDRLVHVDIDDQSVGTIGRWPWSRDTIADMIDEMGRAGAKVIGFDVLWAEPQAPDVITRRGDDGVKVVVEEIDADAALAGAVKRFG